MIEFQFDAMKRFMIFTLILFAFAFAFESCSSTSKSKGVRDATTLAREIIDKSFSQYKVLIWKEVSVDEKSPSITVNLEEGFCYRIVAVRAGGFGSDEITLGFKHSEQVVETGTDFIDFSAGDGEKRKERVIWGFCVWPNLVGKLEIFNNLSSTGGCIVVLSARAEKIGWKGGKDIKLYLMGNKKINLEQIEKLDVEPALKHILSKDHMNLPSQIQGKKPIFYDIVGVTGSEWDYSFDISSLNCYHMLLVSPNCTIKFKIVDADSKTNLRDDGAPEGVGRNGWASDFCFGSNISTGKANIGVSMKMVSDKYERCWFAFAIYGYEASPSEIKKVQNKDNYERKKAAGQIKKCEISKASCEKGCKKGKGKKDNLSDPSCNLKCHEHFVKCAKGIRFPGEFPLQIAE